MMVSKLPTRKIEVPSRRVALPDELQDQQIQRGLFTVERGVTYPMPMDHMNRQDTWQGQKVWTSNEQHGTYRIGTKFKPAGTNWQRKALEFARDHIHREIPYWYYLATLGHDLHISTYSALFARHWHVGWADPLTGEVQGAIDPWFTSLFATHWVDHVCDLPVCPRDAGINITMLQSLSGFIENLGLLSNGLITTAFVSEEIDELVTTTATEYADFDFAEVGTNAAAENNTHVALQTSSGIARVAGTPTDSDPIYQSVATITADATESWEEHGLFNNLTGVAMMDRSLTGGQSVNSSDQVEYTYQLTKNAEV